jgi:hypothetical protein
MGIIVRSDQALQSAGTSEKLRTPYSTKKSTCHDALCSPARCRIFPRLPRANLARVGVETADEAKLAQSAQVLTHISTHNAYHIGQIIYVRKQQGSWDPKNGVR